MLTLANIRNGLAFPHDDVCYFQSQYGHKAKLGYFRIDSMPYRAVIHLLMGKELKIVDATRRHKLLTDALKFGVPTWCLVFNRSLGKTYRSIKVCDWETPEMRRLAHHTDIHESSIDSIRKLIHLYGYTKPAIIGDNILLECHQAFVADDQIERLRKLICEQKETQDVPNET